MSLADDLRRAVADDEAAYFFAWAAAQRPREPQPPTLDPERVRALLTPGGPRLGLALADPRQPAPYAVR